MCEEIREGLEGMRVNQLETKFVALPGLWPSQTTGVWTRVVMKELVEDRFKEILGRKIYRIC